MTLKEQIVEVLRDHPGLSDREITNEILGRTEHQQPVNTACKGLERRGRIKRKKREDGRIGNYLTDATPPVESLPPIKSISGLLTEDEIKKTLESWLKVQGWTVKIAWGRERGSDVVATRKDAAPWIIEVKGHGAGPQAQGNNFLAILGQILQRMSDPSAKYSIAMPDLPRFRGLWERLPDGAKARVGITAALRSSRWNRD